MKKTQTSGQRLTEELYFPYFDRDYYIGLYSYDSSGNRGKISNLVHVNIPAPLTESTEPVPSSPAVPRLGLLTTENDWIMVGVLCGILLVLIAITAASITYFCCINNKQRQQQQNEASASVSDVNVASSRSSDQTDGTDASSFDSDLKNISVNDILHRYNVKDIEFGLSRQSGRQANLTNSRESPGGKFDQSTRLTPVYWSASQLL